MEVYVIGWTLQSAETEVGFPHASKLHSYSRYSSFIRSLSQFRTLHETRKEGRLLHNGNMVLLQVTSIQNGCIWFVAAIYNKITAILFKKLLQIQTNYWLIKANIYLYLIMQLTVFHQGICRSDGTATDGDEQSASCHSHITITDIASCTHWWGGCVALGASQDTMQKRKISCPCWESNPCHTSSQPSHYTDRATSLQLLNYCTCCFNSCHSCSMLKIGRNSPIWV
jgi:hypothetical protein